METMLAVPGSALWVEDNEGDGLPVVLLHPGWADSRIWDALIALLPPGTRVIRFDGRGFGRSPAPTEAFTACGDLVAVLDHLSIAKALLVGHSGGGATALSLAVTEPARVSSMVLVAPGISDYPWPGDDPYFAEFVTLYEAADHEGLVDLGMRTWAAAGHDPGIQALMRTAVDGMFSLDDFMAADPPVMDRLRDIQVAVAILVGDLESPDMSECVQVAAARVPASSLRVVAGADHMLPARAPAVVAEATLAQLAVTR
jgi:3-oxoadipate enol-lactonase